MRHLLYVHTKTAPLVVLLTRAIAAAAGRRLLPILRRLLPGRRGRRIISTILLVVGLVVQAVLLWTLGELISLCIDLAELWTALARKHLEITL